MFSRILQKNSTNSSIIILRILRKIYENCISPKAFIEKRLEKVSGRSVISNYGKPTEERVQ